MDNYRVSKKTAEVFTIENLKVFTDCEPVLEYEYLGTVSKIFALSGQYEPLRNAIIQKAKKNYPTAEGIIFHFVNGGIDKADVIKFK